MKKLERILVAVDLSSCSRVALDQAIALAEQVGARSIDVLYVAEVPEFRNEPRIASGEGLTSVRDYALNEARAELEEFLAALPSEQRKLVQPQLEAGRPRDVILDRAKRYDLLVMGTHGRTGRAHSMAGSLTESVVRMAPVPLLAVREQS